MPYRLPPDKKALLLQNKVFDGGLADDGHSIILPKNTTAKLAEMTSQEAMIAYDTDLQKMVLDTGGGYAPVGGGGAVASVNGQTGVVVLAATDVAAANQNLSNLTNSTAINAHLIPAAPDAINLGNASHEFSTLYVSQINDNTDFGSVLINNRVLQDAFGNNSVQWDARRLDNGGTALIDWSNPAQISFNTHPLTNIVDPTNPQDAATKNYVDSNIPAPGANTALSNLISPTAINQDLTFQNVDLGNYPPKLWTIKTSDASGSHADDLTIHAGGATGGGVHGGRIVISTGDAPHPHGIDLITASANPFVGGDNGGRILLQTGNGPGGRGIIYIVNGSEGTIGNVLTSVGTSGEANWAPASANILAFTSSPSVGGAVQETVVVTGLLTSDTVLSVSQKTMGSATRTSQPLIQWNVGSNGHITLDWVADPGAGAIVVVTVKR